MRQDGSRHPHHMRSECEKDKKPETESFDILGIVFLIILLLVIAFVALAGLSQ